MASIFGHMRRKNGTRKRKRIRTDRHGLAQADCAACLKGTLSDNSQYVGLSSIGPMPLSGHCVESRMGASTDAGAPPRFPSPLIKPDVPN